MRLAKAALLLLPLLNTGCLLVPRVYYDIPLAASDPIWKDAAPARVISGRTIEVNGEKTQLAGVNVSDMTERERKEFEVELAELLRNKEVIAQPVSPGLSRLFVAGKPVYEHSKYLDYGQANVWLSFIPRLVAARPERIDVAHRLIRKGRVRAVPEEVKDATPLPESSPLLFVPDLPLRLGRKRGRPPLPQDGEQIAFSYMDADRTLEAWLSSQAVLTE